MTKGADAWTGWSALEDKVRGEKNPAHPRKGLSPRQSWILCALEALDRADRTMLVELRSHRDDRDLRELNRLVDARPDDYDPTTFRAAIKNKGVANKPFPTLDLMRMVVVAIGTKGPHRRPPGLAKAAADRPVLRAALMALSPKYSEEDMDAELRLRSPRLQRWWRAALGQLQQPGKVRAYLAEHGLEADFPADGWPDLDQVPNTGPEQAFEEWYAEPATTAWSKDIGDWASDYAASATDGERGLLLSKLLDGLRRAVEQGAVQRMHQPLETARACNAMRPKSPEREALRGKLDQLAMRAAYWSEGVGEQQLVELCSAVHQGSEALPPWLAGHLLSSWIAGERNAMAARWNDNSAYRKPTADKPYGDFAPDFAQSIAVCLASVMHDGAKGESLALSILMQHGTQIPIAAAAGAVPLAPADSQASFRAVHYASRRDYARCFGAIQAAAAGGQSLWVHASITRMREVCKGAPELPMEVRRRTLSAATEALCALADSSAPASASVLNDMLELLDEGLDIEIDQAFLDAIVAAATSTIAQPLAPGATDQYPRVQLLWTLMQDGELLSELARFGRWMRDQPRDVALSSALNFVADLAGDPDVVRACSNRPSRRKKKHDAPESVVEWMRVITRWLDAQDRSEVEQTALEIDRNDPFDSGLETWFLGVSQTPMSPEFSEALAEFSFTFDSPL